MSTDLNDYEIKLLANIKEHGWFSVGVFDKDGNEPDFRYSVGISKTHSAPELIVFGLPLDILHNMLWEMYRQIGDGNPLANGKRWTGLLEGFDCVSREIHPSNIVPDYFGSLLWYWTNIEPGLDRKIFQIVWPGAQDGLFPWDEDCDQIVIDAQPPLWLPTTDG
ncbi:MAG: DUF4262 domain-containing protein [Pseudomonadota bacterium]